MVPHYFQMNNGKPIVYSSSSQVLPHLSCYALTVEEKTPLYHYILKGIKPEIDTDQTSEAISFTYVFPGRKRI